MTTIQVPSINDLPKAAEQFISTMSDATVYAFHGEMGAGKTTFINALCDALGVETDDTNSPTFAIVNEYRSDTTAELIYHIDCYRLESLAEAMDIGMEDIFDCGALCFIEWPEKVDDLLPSDTVDVNIKVNEDGSRTIVIDD